MRVWLRRGRELAYRLMCRRLFNCGDLARAFVIGWSIGVLMWTALAIAQVGFEARRVMP